MKQLEFKKVKGWGGKRRGAGRKNKSGTLNHMKRDQARPQYPMHITLKLRRGLISLRGPKMMSAFQKSLEQAKVKGLRVIHFAVESNHVHLFAETNNNRKLRAGMASLAGRYGRVIRKLSGGRGSVFNGRYHSRVLKTPRETKNALAYVLLNHSKHEGVAPYRDDKSSAAYFSEWNALLGGRYRKLPAEDIPDYLSGAESWLARVGWRRAS